MASKPRLQVETSGVSSKMAAAAAVGNVQLLSPVKAVQVLQDEVVAESILVLRRKKTAAFCPLNGAWGYFPGRGGGEDHSLTRDSTMLGLQLRRVFTA